MDGTGVTDVTHEIDLPIAHIYPLGLSSCILFYYYSRLVSLVMSSSGLACNSGSYTCITIEAIEFNLGFFYIIQPLKSHQQVPPPPLQHLIIQS